MQSQNWIFTRGDWASIDDPITDETYDNHNGMVEEALNELGYTSASDFTYRDGWAFGITLYMGGEHAPYPYMLCFEIGGDSTAVYIADFPSLITLLSQVASFPILSKQTEDIEEAWFKKQEAKEKQQRGRG